MYSPWLEYLVSIEVTSKTYSYLPYNCINSLCSLRVNDFVTANLESPAIYLCGLLYTKTGDYFSQDIPPQFAST